MRYVIGVLTGIGAGMLLYYKYEAITAAAGGGCLIAAGVIVFFEPLYELILDFLP